MAVETADPSSVISPRQQAFVLGATILASAMAFIDGNVVTVALPSIQKGLNSDFASVQWVLNGYSLMLGALIVVAGGLGDLYGRRRVFLAGIVLFTLSSVACGLAQSIGFLIGARVLQGVGAALLIPQSLAIISATFPRQRRGRAIGTWAAVSGATTAFGPPLGGFLVDLLNWRAAFWLNVPLAVVAIWLTLRAVPETRDPNARGGIDWTGAILATIGFGAVAYGLGALSEGLSDVPAIAWIAIVAGIVAIVLFAVVETRVSNPLVPPSLFRSGVFTGTNIATVFLYGCLAAVLFLLPYELGVRRNLTAGQIGLTLMPVGIIIAAASRFTGGLSDRMGPRPFLLVGTAVVAVACAIFALGLSNYWIGIVLPLIVLAGGMAVVVSPLTTAVMNAVPEGRSGAASGVNNAASRVGGLLAVAIFGALAALVYIGAAGSGADRFGVLPEVGSAARPALESAFDSAYRTAMWFAAVWAALATLAVAVFVRDDRPAKT